MFTTDERPWDSPGLPAGERCRWHRGLCAYHEADPARCTYCHAQPSTCECSSLHPVLSLETALSAIQAAKSGTPAKGLREQFSISNGVAVGLVRRAVAKKSSDSEQNDEQEN
ncbi:hypothetical protein SEA_PHINKBODEN_104 [Gordonia Phage PhinkBoden]|nr:hypothetical protein SEA_PHINKBODEN_104 [Gordonia Phage PhinkBoden]